MIIEKKKKSSFDSISSPEIDLLLFLLFGAEISEILFFSFFPLGQIGQFCNHGTVENIDDMFFSGPGASSNERIDQFCFLLTGDQRRGCDAIATYRVE